MESKGLFFVVFGLGEVGTLEISEGIDRAGISSDCPGKLRNTWKWITLVNIAVFLKQRQIFKDWSIPKGFFGTCQRFASIIPCRIIRDKRIT